ncbi:MAG: alpha/beta hydrolase [Planctomycetaceae bacterium]|nr:alpha/beta hydrolase [Planctomycetaceae bacterium]
MKPLHLQIEVGSEGVSLKWFGESAVYSAGSVQYDLRMDADTSFVPDPYLIDLHPLFAEVARGDIADADTLARADEFLALHDLLDSDSLTDLADKLFRFLYPLSRLGKTFAATHKSLDGRIWIDPDRRLVRVWFATDRRVVRDGDAVHHFSSLEPADEITYGVCNVFIPESHKPGSTGTPFWRRWICLKADDSLKLHSIHDLPADVFWAGLNRKLSSWWKEGERNLFVYIHGYNVSFEQAAIGAAQIGYDLKVPGEIAFYSWPSHASPIEYSADEATIGGSVQHMAHFLSALSARSGAERIHLFVHSMGNRGFLSALERIVANHEPQLSLGQVFFCAPDEDVRTFRDKSTRFPHRSERRTLLVSPEDNAVFLSREKHGQLPRVGYVSSEGPTIIDGIDTVEVGGFGMFNLGHGYFASAERVIHDIRDAITFGRPAAEREIPRPFNKHFVIDVRNAREDAT